MCTVLLLNLILSYFIVQSHTLSTMAVNTLTEYAWTRLDSGRNRRFSTREKVVFGQEDHEAISDVKISIICIL